MSQQKPQQPPRPYVVRSHGVAIAIVIAHRPENAVSTVVNNQYTAEVPSALELLELTRQHIRVIDPLGALPAPTPPSPTPPQRSLLDSLVGFDPPPPLVPAQSPLLTGNVPAEDASTPAESLEARRYNLEWRSGDVQEQITLKHALAELEADALLTADVLDLTIGGALHYDRWTLERVA